MVFSSPQCGGFAFTRHAFPGKTQARGTAMFGLLLGAACTAAEVCLLVKIRQVWTWHHRGVGERSARAEYARIRREQPDIAEARLSESEFAHHFVTARPGVARYVIAALLALVGIAIAIACGTLDALL